MQLAVVKKKAIVLWLVCLCVGTANAKEGTSAYGQKLQKAGNLQSKIADQEKEIKELIEVKQKTADEDRKRQAIQRMVEIHTQLKKDVKEYNDLINELKYKYPAKEDETSRAYAPAREKTIDDMEEESALDRALTEAKKNVDEKYAPFTGYREPEQQSLPSESEPEPAKPVKGKTQERLKLSK